MIGWINGVVGYHLSSIHPIVHSASILPLKHSKQPGKMGWMVSGWMDVKWMDVGCIFGYMIDIGWSVGYLMNEWMESRLVGCLVGVWYTKNRMPH